MSSHDGMGIVSRVQTGASEEYLGRLWNIYTKDFGSNWNYFCIGTDIESPIKCVSYIKVENGITIRFCISDTLIYDLQLDSKITFKKSTDAGNTFTTVWTK